MNRTTSLRRNTAFDLSKTEFLKPQTRMEANRWLQKACIGGGATAVADLSATNKVTFVAESATPVDDAVKLMADGYAAWITDQFDEDNEDIRINLDEQLMDLEQEDAVERFGADGGDSLYQIWFETLAVYGKSKLRLKMVYALSQIFTCRGSEPFMDSYLQSLYDATASNNTSSFRQLLKEMTYSPAMGYWLTYEENKKANPSISRLPDENYAREVMQLFTVGLICRNMDGTPLLDSEGNTIPTYTEFDVKECAKFMTGLRNPDFSPYRWMRHQHGNHELSSKTLFAYPGGSPVVLPAQTDYTELDRWMKTDGYAITVVNANSFTVTVQEPKEDDTSNSPFRYRLAKPITSTHVDALVTWSEGSTTATVTKVGHGLTTGTIIYAKHCVEDSIDAFLDHLFNHPTCPPFIATALIKFLVTSNPTPGYIERVAKVFVNNGAGVRGDLSKVVTAILLDREAIIPYDANPANRGRHLTYFERLHKVLNGLRSELVHVNYREGLRFLEKDSVFTSPPNEQHFKCYALANYYGMNKPFAPPSVFNYFRPGFIPPSSALADVNLTGPELQINTPESQTVWQNMVCGALNYIFITDWIGEFDNFNPFTADNLLDPRGGYGLLGGIDFNPHPDGFEVTAIGAESITVSGVLNSSSEEVSEVFKIWIYNRTKEEYMYEAMDHNCGFVYARPATSGIHTFDIFVDWFGGVGNYDVGDVLDIHPAVVMPHGGFVGPATVTGGGDPGSKPLSVHIPLLYRFAAQIPNTETVTTGEVNTCIDYIQDVFMGRPISAGLRAMMMTAAQLPVTIPEITSGMQISSDSATANHWANFYYDRKQIRVRRMLAILFVSPEFSIVD